MSRSIPSTLSALALLAFAAGSALLAFGGPKGSRRALDEESIRFAMAHGRRGPAFEEDGIRFLVERMAERDAHGQSDDPLGRARLARLYLSRFKATGAAEDLRKGVAGLERSAREEPHDAGAHGALAGAYLACHRFRDAVGQARLARALASGSEEIDAARSALFDALTAAGRYAEAAAQLDSLGPAARASAGLARRARVLAMRDSLPAARALFDTALREALAASASPGVKAWYRVERAGLSERMGDLPNAIADLKQALLDSPGYPAALEGLARIAYAWDGNLAAAARLFEAAQGNGGHLTLLLDRERVAREMGDSARADSLRSAFVGMSAGDSAQSRWNRLPLAYQFAEEPAKRDEALRLAVAEADERATPEAWTCLAWVYYKRGSVPVSYHFARLAAAAPMRDPAGLARLALIAWHAGKRKEAEALLAEALARNGRRFAWKSGKNRGTLDESGEFRPLGLRNAGDLLALHTHGT